jgi:hypothetical protein
MNTMVPLQKDTPGITRIITPYYTYQFDGSIGSARNSWVFATFCITWFPTYPLSSGYQQNLIWMMEWDPSHPFWIRIALHHHVCLQPNVVNHEMEAAENIMGD